MMRSSGILVVEQNETVACLACDWEGQLVTWTDPEIHKWGFTCPRCTTEEVRDY